MENEKIEEEIKQYATEYAELNPNLKSVYLFPDRDNKSVNLLYVEADYRTSGGPDKVDIFIFANQFGNEVRPLSVGTIAPYQENNNGVLPKSWGEWKDAKKIWESK